MILSLASDTDSRTVNMATLTASRVSLAPKILFPFPFKRLPRRLLCTTARSIVIFMRTALSCLCFFFLNQAAEIMLNMLFNTLLSMTPHIMKKRRRRKQRTSYGPSRRYSRRATHPVPNPARQGLTLVPQLNRISRG